MRTMNQSLACSFRCARRTLRSISELIRVSLVYKARPEGLFGAARFTLRAAVAMLRRSADFQSGVEHSLITSEVRIHPTYRMNQKGDCPSGTVPFFGLYGAPGEITRGFDSTRGILPLGLCGPPLCGDVLRSLRSLVELNPLDKSGVRTSGKPINLTVPDHHPLSPCQPA